MGISRIFETCKSKSTRWSCLKGHTHSINCLRLSLFVNISQVVHHPPRIKVRFLRTLPVTLHDLVLLTESNKPGQSSRRKGKGHDSHDGHDGHDGQEKSAKCGFAITCRQPDAACRAQQSRDVGLPFHALSAACEATPLKGIQNEEGKRHTKNDIDNKANHCC